MDDDELAPIQEEEIQQFIFHLDRCNSNNDQERAESEEKINEICSDRILRSVFIFAEIILRDGIDFGVVYLSLVWIRRIFTPTHEAPEEVITEKWLKIDPQLRGRVKSAIIRGIMFPNQQIASITSLTFCALLNIEKIEMFDLIPAIFEIYDDPKYDNLTKAAALNIIAEISSPDSIGGHTDTEEVREIMVKIFEKIGTYFSNSLTKPIDIRYNIARAISTFLDVADALFKHEETTYSLIDIVIENLESSPKEEEEAFTAPDQLHTIFLQILLKIVKLHYSNEEFKPDKIFDYVSEKILEYNDPTIDQNIISNYLLFWTELADFERGIIKKNNLKKAIEEKMKLKYKKDRIKYDQEISVERGFCSTAVERLTEKLVYIMNMINPKDPDAEDVTSKMPHMFATCCLQSFFKIEPEQIFVKIRELWRNGMNEYYKLICQKLSENPESDIIPEPIDWINDHTLLLTISIFCRKTIVPNQITSMLYEFFFEPFANDPVDYIVLRDYILGTCMKAFNFPKIIDTTLFALTLLYERYPSFLNIDSVDMIFNWIGENINVKDEIIFNRIIQLITMITSKKILPHISSEVKIKLLEHYEHIIKLFFVGISREDSINNDIYRNSYLMISNASRFSILVYSYFPNSNDDFMKNIGELINSQLTMLREASQFNEDGFNYNRQSNILYFFNTIYFLDDKYNKFLLDFTDPLVEIYSGIMKPGAKIFQEGLTALEIIVRCLKDSGADLLRKVNELVREGLESGSPSIIIRSAYVRASLYQQYINNKYVGYEELLENFESNYNMINECLTNHQDFTREYYPILLKALGLIIDSCSVYIQNEKSEMIDTFISQFLYFADMPLTVENENENDIEYANTFYDAMFVFATSIFKCISEASNLKQNTRLMKKINDGITKSYFSNLEYNFSDNSLNSFFNYIKQYIKTFGHKGNVIINRNSNYKILFNAACSKNKKTQKEALIYIKDLINS